MASTDVQLGELEALVAGTEAGAGGALAARAAPPAGRGSGARGGGGGGGGGGGVRGMKSDDEKPHLCTFQGCSYRAAEAHHLVRHTRTHTGEKPYACAECPYTAAEAGTLARHMKTHGVGKAPLPCTHSGCSFFAPSRVLLKQHTKSAHPPPL
jgi:uncharacterized Zn-finger protein